MIEVELSDSASFIVTGNAVPYTAIFMVRPGWEDMFMISETTFESKKGLLVFFIAGDIWDWLYFEEEEA